MKEKTAADLQFLGVGLIFGGAISILTNSVTGGLTLIAFGISGFLKDKQHTGKWFP